MRDHPFVLHLKSFWSPQSAPSMLLLPCAWSLEGLQPHDGEGPPWVTLQGCSLLLLRPEAGDAQSSVLQPGTTKSWVVAGVCAI